MLIAVGVELLPILIHFCHVDSIGYTKYLTMVIQGGVSFDKSNNVKYEHGTMMFVDFVKPKCFNSDKLEAIVHVCGMWASRILLLVTEGNLGCALKKLGSEANVREMLEKCERT